MGFAYSRFSQVSGTTIAKIPPVLTSEAHRIHDGTAISDSPE